MSMWNQRWAALVAVLLMLCAPMAAAASYTVRSGDTLFTIARTHGITVARLQMLNPGTSTLRPGQRLQLGDIDSSPTVRPAAKRAPSTAKAAIREQFTAPSRATGITRVASTHIGARYVWGSSRPGAFDCSGFTKYVLGKYGVRLPHSAAMQSRMGQFVSRSKLQPGDLVFFATAGAGRVSHVALYVGNNQVVHATNPREGVVRSSLSERYWSNRYLSARRVL
jgi:peptidoglycan DL-endopeptidase LytE